MATTIPLEQGDQSVVCEPYVEDDEDDAPWFSGQFDESEPFDPVI